MNQYNYSDEIVDLQIENAVHPSSGAVRPSIVWSGDVDYSIVPDALSLGSSVYYF